MEAENSISVTLAMVGVFFFVNNGEGLNFISSEHIVVIIYGLLAAALYASMIMMNKFIKKLSDFQTTFIQLFTASILLLPYVFLKEGFGFSGIDTKSIIFIFIIGILFIQGLLTFYILEQSNNRFV